MKQRKVVDAYIRVEPSSGWWSRGDPEANLNAFLQSIRNHRDLDEYNAHVVREFEEVCSFCGYHWEVADKAETFEDGSTVEVGEPVCCGRAQEEWLVERVVA